MSASNIACVALAIAVLAGACNKDKDPGGRQLAVVSGKAVSQKDFDAFLKLKRVSATDPARLEKLLDDYVKREALAAVIEQGGQLDAALAAAELNEFRKEMLISRYFEQLLDDKVSDEAVKGYYDSHAAEFEERKVRVAHILFRTHARMTPEEQQAQLTHAREAHAKLGSGTDFAEVAKALSEDRVSGEKGGDLGWIGEGGVDPQFSAKVFAMKADEVSEPFETGFGYHVVKVLEAPQTARKPYEAVQGDIRYKLRAELKNAETERLFAQAKVERKAAPQPVAAESGTARRDKKARPGNAP